MRTFCPKPVAKMIMNIGGTSALLGLIAMATDVEGIYAAVKALVCVVHSNKEASREMDRTKGYQVGCYLVLAPLCQYYCVIMYLVIVLSKKTSQLGVSTYAKISCYLDHMLRKVVLHGNTHFLQPYF